MKLNKYFENFILVCIILVLIQTFLEDYSYIKFWNPYLRRWILISGFVFDLIFSIEFIIRTIVGIKNKSFYKYFFYERGWVDFLSSLPLLLLNSGPYMYFILTNQFLSAASIGVLNILKVVKAVRVARVLRLVRILKIFRKIQNTESIMAQRHIAKIITIGVFSIITILFVFSFTPLNNYSNLILEKKQVYKEYIRVYETIKNKNVNLNSLNDFKLLKEIFINDDDFIKIKYNDQIVFVNPKARYYDFQDVDSFNIGNYKIMYSLYNINVLKAEETIKYFLIIITLVLAYLLIYTRHFAQTVSDVIFILFKGIKQKDYFLEIKIPKYYKEDEIFKFAEFYNNIYLPAKQKLYFKKNKTKSKINFDDIFNFKN